MKFHKTTIFCDLGGVLATQDLRPLARFVNGFVSQPFSLMTIASRLREANLDLLANEQMVLQAIREQIALPLPKRDLREAYRRTVKFYPRNLQALRSAAPQADIIVVSNIDPLLAAVVRPKLTSVCADLAPSFITGWMKDDENFWKCARQAMRHCSTRVAVLDDDREVLKVADGHFLNAGFETLPIRLRPTCGPSAFHAVGRELKQLGW